jgi:hypothetical protein
MANIQQASLDGTDHQNARKQDLSLLEQISRASSRARDGDDSKLRQQENRKGLNNDISTHLQVGHLKSKRWPGSRGFSDKQAGYSNLPPTLKNSGAVNSGAGGKGTVSGTENTSETASNKGLSPKNVAPVPPPIENDMTNVTEEPRQSLLIDSGTETKPIESKTLLGDESELFQQQISTKLNQTANADQYVQ